MLYSQAAAKSTGLQAGAHPDLCRGVRRGDGGGAALHVGRVRERDLWGVADVGLQGARQNVNLTDAQTACAFDTHNAQRNMGAA